MFIGEYNHNIDPKGRLAIPSKFRAKLKAGAVVTRGLDKCLFLYSKEQWEQIAQKLANQPFNKSNVRAFSRLMLAGAVEAEFDRQGRVVLPEYLRKYAGITKKAVVAGLYNRVEIWNEKAWTKYSQQAEKNSNKIAEELEGLGI